LSRTGASNLFGAGLPTASGKWIARSGLGASTMRYSWLDLVFYVLAIVLLVPLVMGLVESVMSCIE
jgi:hypothetical protein